MAWMPTFAGMTGLIFLTEYLAAPFSTLPDTALADVPL
jgi:hypothetical protein